MVISYYRWTAMVKCAVTFVAIAGFTVPGGAADIEWLPYGFDDYQNYWVGGGVNVNGSVVVLTAVTDKSPYPPSYHAFRWTLSDHTMHDLGTFGGNSSVANGVSADGSVVVGSANIPDYSNPLEPYGFWNVVHSHAFRWTLSDNTMHDLGTLGGGTRSWANGVNADGSVVVGGTETSPSGYGSHAFRWTLSDNTMHDLGTLGGSLSSANGVSADGSVVVGWSRTTEVGNEYHDDYHAFLWTLSDNTMHDLGTLGGKYSVATGVNAKGTIVVGKSGTAPNDDEWHYHAFRWTLSDNTMHDLGTLGGSLSSANGVNADGSVVVGQSELKDYTLTAFRWTQATGMQSVEDWMVANGGSRLASGNYLEKANAVSADGQVVTGIGHLNGVKQAFIARGAGVLGVTDFQESFQQPTVAGSILHNRMLAAVTTDLQNNAPSRGQFALSVQGIYDGYTKDMADGDGLSGVFKLIYGLSDSWRFGLSYIRAGERLDISDNGKMNNDLDIFGGLLSYGDYRGEGLRGRLSFAYGNGASDVTRNYLIGSGSDHSTGRMEVEQYGFAAEIGYGFRVAPRTLITPAASYEWIRSSLGAYTETGGPFPTHFYGRSLEDSYVRAGVKVKQSLSSVLDLNADANYVVRLSDSRNPVSGSLVGLGTSGAIMENVELSKDWAELRAGVDYVPESISKNLHLTLGGQANLGQKFDVPSYRIDTGFVLFF